MLLLLLFCLIQHAISEVFSNGKGDMRIQNNDESFKFVRLGKDTNISIVSIIFYPIGLKYVLYNHNNLLLDTT